MRFSSNFLLSFPLNFFCGVSQGVLCTILSLTYSRTRQPHTINSPPIRSKNKVRFWRITSAPSQYNIIYPAKAILNYIFVGSMGALSHNVINRLQVPTSKIKVNFHVNYNNSFLLLFLCAKVHINKSIHRSVIPNSGKFVCLWVSYLMLDLIAPAGPFLHNANSDGSKKFLFLGPKSLLNLNVLARVHHARRYQSTNPNTRQAASPQQ